MYHTLDLRLNITQKTHFPSTYCQGDSSMDDAIPICHLISNVLIRPCALCNGEEVGEEFFIICFVCFLKSTHIHEKSYNWSFIRTNEKITN